MNRNKLIGIILGILLVIGLNIKFMTDYKALKEENKKKTTPTTDAIKFKDEYESLNGKKNGDKEYLSVNIEELNKVVYKTDKEVIDILKNGTGVIYFGFSSCPVCRSMIETLIKSTERNNISEFYYLDISSIRSTFTIENKKLKEEKGTKSYYEILKLLDDYLEDYIINNKYDTKEKRLYAPTIVAVKNGKIIDFHEGTVATNKDPEKGLTIEEKEELLNIYDRIIKEVIK